MLPVRLGRAEPGSALHGLHEVEWLRHREVDLTRRAPAADQGRAAPQLLLFGGVELLTAAGEPVADLQTQTKPLALLAYLAIAEPHGYHRRDQLLGLLWPGLDEDHARGALRKTLHALRRGLGEGALDARGDEELGVKAESLWCDALAFDEAIDAGQTARALDLYRGDLLPGFFVRDAAEFQQWLDEMRTRYQKQAATAAWIMAERSELEERATIAAEWARRAVTLAPYDERVVRKALALLGRVGDRAGAVSLYESFRQRLAREFEVEPAPETSALMRQIRAR